MWYFGVVQVVFIEFHQVSYFLRKVLVSNCSDQNADRNAAQDFISLVARVKPREYHLLASFGWPAFWSERWVSQDLIQMLLFPSVRTDLTDTYGKLLNFEWRFHSELCLIVRPELELFNIKITIITLNIVYFVPINQSIPTDFRILCLLRQNWKLRLDLHLDGNWFSNLNTFVCDFGDQRVNFKFMIYAEKFELLCAILLEHFQGEVAPEGGAEFAVWLLGWQIGKDLGVAQCRF